MTVGSVPDLVVMGSIVTMVIAAVPFMRILATPAVRRELGAAPRLAVTLAFAAIVAVGIAVAAAVRWPTLLPMAAGLAVLAMAAGWWRARPGYGGARGWPRGSLGVRASLLAIDDRNFFRDLARRYGPVFKFSQYGRPVVGIVGFGVGRELLHRRPDALAPAPLPYNRLVPKGMLRYMTPDDHRREAAAFRAAFVGVDLATVEAGVRQACRTALERALGSPDPGGTPMTEPLRIWANVALARLFFGVGEGDPRLDHILQLRERLIVDGAGRAQQRRLESALADGAALLAELVEGAAPKSGSVLAGLCAGDPKAVRDLTRSSNLSLTYRLATTDLSDLLSWLLAMLTDHPSWVDAVRRAPRVAGPPAGSQPTDLASRVVLETLRLEQSEFLYRRLLKPVELAGFRIPAGWLVRICVQESHRDPAIFSDPDRFDPDRFLHRTYGRSEYSPFGADNHGCLGAAMVLFLGRVFVEELCHGFEWRIVADGPPTRGPRLRHHWRPSPRRRLVVARRAEHPAG